MANVTAADVKRLREMTGAGMMDCKKALEENDGDFDAAVEFLRVKGQASAAKRGDRSASNGVVVAQVADGVGTMIQLNCETDFVAKGESFTALAQQVLDQAVATGAEDVPSLLASEIGGKSVEALLTEANATIGEKIVLGGVVRVKAAHVASYLHRKATDLPPQIGVLVGTDGPSDIARDVAMHAAAMRPTYLSREDIPAEIIEQERRIAEERSREEGKPEQALPKIVEGRVEAFVKDVVLVEQKFAKDQSRVVRDVIKEAGVTVLAYARFEIGA